MVECEFCGEEFDDEQDLHAHWSEHEDELNSHQKDKMKKAKRKKEEQEKNRKEKRKKQAFYAMAGVLGLAVAALVVPQLMPSGGSSNYNVSTEGQPVIGNDSAEVTVIEFGDYRCPYCRQFEMNTFPQLKENYIDTGQVKFSFINLAFLGQGSEQAANAGECVYRQNETQFWDFHQAVYENQGSESENWVTNDLMMQIARDNTEGLDYDELETCFSQRQASNDVRDDRAIANTNGVSSTPTIFVNGQMIQGNDYGAISSAIENELQ